MPAAPVSNPVLPLGDFDRLIRSCEEFQPFLGIDAIEVHGPVDAEKLRAAAEDELAILGVGLPLASGDGRTVMYRPGRPNINVEAIDSSLADHCSNELNRRFRPDVDPLVRLWVVRTAPHPHIGMTWQHWPMDGVSASDLFRRILSRFAGFPVVNQITATDLVVPDVKTIYRPWQTWRHWFAYQIESIREAIAATRIYSIPRPRPDQTRMRVHLLDLQHPARPAGATLNDVVAAALLWAIADVLPERHRKWWRRRIDLINFVDLRSVVGEPLERAWGMFLAFSILHLPEPKPAQWKALIESVCAQSVRIRDGQWFFASLDAFKTLRRIFPWLPRRWRWSLPYKVAPFAAGLTNTRFRGEWVSEPMQAHFGRSWRCAPLGVMAPLTADVCTKENQLSLALTCEENSFMSERIETIQNTMRELLAKR
ncbi:MAG: hypothetical protein K8T89_19525 [Planctomycetes bacterium]|nr:hypothetical protein [Planctomycetota bacterium]